MHTKQNERARNIGVGVCRGSAHLNGCSWIMRIGRTMRMPRVIICLGWQCSCASYVLLGLTQIASVLTQDVSAMHLASLLSVLKSERWDE